MNCEKCGIKLTDSMFAEAVDSPYLKKCDKCNQKLFVTTMPDNVEPVYFKMTLGKCDHEYPEVEPFLTWMEANPQPENDDVSMVKFIKPYWAYVHHLCIIVQVINQEYLDFCVTAEKNWVKQKCPCLLTTHTQFLVSPNKNGDYIGNLGNTFLKYCPSNWGIYVTDGVRVLDNRLGAQLAKS